MDLGLGTDIDGWQVRNDTYPDGVSDAEFLSRWSKWQEFDHTIRWFGHDGEEIDPGLGALWWDDVAYTQVNPEPGVVVRGRHDPREDRDSG